MIIILEGERPMSWNTMYAGAHWSKRKAEADRVHELVWAYIKETNYFGAWKEKVESGKAGRVDIHITAYFKNRELDPDNICSKMYIDGLIGNLIEDDTRERVRKVTVQSEIDCDNPRVEIEVLEI